MIPWSIWYKNHLCRSHVGLQTVRYLEKMWSVRGHLWGPCKYEVVSGEGLGHLWVLVCLRALEPTIYTDVRWAFHRDPYIRSTSPKAMLIFGILLGRLQAPQCHCRYCCYWYFTAKEVNHYRLRSFRLLIMFGGRHFPALTLNLSSRGLSFCVYCTVVSSYLN